MNVRYIGLFAFGVSALGVLAFDARVTADTKHRASRHHAAQTSTQDYQLVYSTAGPGWMDPPAGGSGGDAFDDRNDIPRKATVTYVIVRAGMEVDSVRFVWNSTLSGPQHGGAGGTETDIHLAKGEYITGLAGECSSVVNQLTILTNRGHFGPYGDFAGATPFYFKARAGYSIVGIHGRAGMLIDQIGPIYQRIPPLPRS